nr:MAG TPA: distal tail protein [Caudoviricetes sp.]
MAITYPYDILADYPGWSVEFDLAYRQEHSRSTNGITYSKDFGSPLWSAAFQFKSLKPNALDAWRARIKALEGGLQQFRGGPTSRCYPIAYPNGTGMGDVSAVTVGSIATDRKTVGLSGLPVGYIASVGDYIQIGGNNLHQIVSVSGASVEVRPHLWPVSAVGDAVTLVKPSCLMTIVPGSINTTADLSTGRGVITFQGFESR